MSKLPLAYIELLIANKLPAISEAKNKIKIKNKRSGLGAGCYSLSVFTVGAFGFEQGMDGNR